MKDSLANNVGTRINEFENLEVQTVGMFNELFPECPLRKYDLKSEVIIGEVLPNNCRLLTVTTAFGLCAETFPHKMYSDIMWLLDRDVYGEDEREVELEIEGW